MSAIVSGHPPALPEEHPDPARFIFEVKRNPRGFPGGVISVSMDTASVGLTSLTWHGPYAASVLIVQVRDQTPAIRRLQMNRISLTLPFAADRLLEEV